MPSSTGTVTVSCLQVSPASWDESPGNADSLGREGDHKYKRLPHMRRLRGELAPEQNKELEKQNTSERIRELMTFGNQVMQMREVREFLEFLENPKDWLDYGGRDMNRLKKGKEKYFDLLDRMKEFFESDSRHSKAVQLMAPEGIGEYAIRIFPQAALIRSKVTRGEQSYNEYRFATVSEGREMIEQSLQEMKREIEAAKQVLEELDKSANS